MTNPNPTIQFSPQSVEKLKEKYIKAIEKVWTWNDLEKGDRPGKHSEYIFDFYSGLRLIISKDLYERRPEPRIQISASWLPDTKIKPKSYNEARTQVENMYKTISGDRNAKLELIAISKGNVPHWLVRL